MIDVIFLFGETGQVLECSLAKPPSDRKSDTGPNAQKSSLLPSHPPRAGYGLMGGAYGLGAGYGAAAFPQVTLFLFEMSIIIRKKNHFLHSRVILSQRIFHFLFYHSW